jgi:hypothetical protein
MARPVLEGVNLLHPLPPGPWGTLRVLEPASSRALGRVGYAETGWARAGCARDTLPTREYLVLDTMSHRTEAMVGRGCEPRWPASFGPGPSSLKSFPERQQPSQIAGGPGKTR